MKRLPLGYKAVKCFIDEERISESPLKIKHTFSIPVGFAGGKPNLRGFEIDIKKPIKIMFNYLGDNGFLCDAIFEIWIDDAGGVHVAKCVHTQHGTNTDIFIPDNLDITLNYRDKPGAPVWSDVSFDYTNSTSFRNPTNIVAIVPLGDHEIGYSQVIEE